jgi:vacuolar-type H+-ATPase subunit E/Vma4
MKKVQFTRTVALEDVPKEVSKMLRESEEAFKKSTTGIFSLLEEELMVNKNHTQFLATLEQFRTELARADSVLDDCRNIVSGYVQILTSPEEPEQVPPEDQLKKMQQMMQDMQQGGGE